MDKFLVPLLGNFTANKQLFTSFVLAGCYTVQQLVRQAGDASLDTARRTWLRACCVRVVRALLPWTQCSYGSVRCLAQHAIVMSKDVITDSCDPGFTGAVSAFFTFLDETGKAGGSYESLVR